MSSKHARSSNTDQPIRQRVAGGDVLTLEEIVASAVHEAHGVVWLCESSRDPYALEQLPGVSIYSAHVPRDYRTPTRPKREAPRFRASSASQR